MAGLSARSRLRLSLVFALFEAGMRPVGVLVGSAASGVEGAVAGLVAIAVLAIVGGWMLCGGQDKAPEEMLRRADGVAAVGLGLSVNLDELAIGFTHWHPAIANG